MPTPTPIGRIEYDEPRAVRVRDPHDLSSTHSAVHSGINVSVDSKRQAELVMSYWGSLMTEVNKWIEELIKQNPDN